MLMELHKQFKIRSSAIGKIMTNPQTVAARDRGDLSKTAQTWCDEWIRDYVYNRRAEIASKYTAKGHITEESSIDIISRVLDIPFISKNDVQFSNDWITGEPDILPEFEPHTDLIIDAKNSFSYETFPLLFTHLPNKDYRWQGQGYMAMTGRKHYKVAYVLSNTPDHMIVSAALSHGRLYGETELKPEMYYKYKKLMTYDDVPDELRVRVFDFDRDEDEIESIYRRVEQCREYIKKRVATLPRDKNNNLIITKR